MKKSFAKALFGMTVLFAVIAIFYGLESFSSPKYTGQAVVTESPSIEKQDAIEIKNVDLLKCCTYLDSFGKQKSCFVVSSNKCDHCSQFC